MLDLGYATPLGNVGLMPVNAQYRPSKFRLSDVVTSKIFHSTSHKNDQNEGCGGPSDPHTLGECFLSSWCSR